MTNIRGYKNCDVKNLHPALSCPPPAQNGRSRNEFLNRKNIKLIRAISLYKFAKLLMNISLMYYICLNENHARWKCLYSAQSSVNFWLLTPGQCLTILWPTLPPPVPNPLADSTVSAAPLLCLYSFKGLRTSLILTNTLDFFSRTIVTSLFSVGSTSC